MKKNNSSGSTYATIASGGVRTYGFGDIKQYTFNSNGTADSVLDVKVALPGSGPIISGQSGSNLSQTATITSTLSNFASQLRIGDVVEFSNNNLSHEVKVTGVTNNSQFTVQNLKSSNQMANGAISGSIIRTRPELKEGTKKELLTPLG